MKANFPIIIFIFFIFLTETAFTIDPKFETCSIPKSCGDNQTIKYPFYIQNQQQPFCGYPGFILKCHNSGHPILELSGGDYLVHNISYETQTIHVSDNAISPDSGCFPEKMKNLSLPLDRRFELDGTEVYYLIYNCSDSRNLEFDGDLEQRGVCFSGGTVVAVKGNEYDMNDVIGKCGKGAVVVAAPVKYMGELGTAVEAMRSGFVLKWRAGDGECRVCGESGGICGTDERNLKSKCYCSDQPHPFQCIPENKKGIKQSLRNHVLGIMISIGITLLFLSIIIVFGLWYKRKGLNAAKSDLEGEHVYFEVPIFSYSELEKATNKFDHDKELGNGGYGAVYLGKLHDGREVAVKRLYQRSKSLDEQFMNEVKILTRLRHKNLVSLYGCTSNKSHELLLVYEFIPNGTVADHLHGKRANPSLLTWPIRMSIAIETASALAYLHASDIIHRDVKTNNILLDNNFSVKVADFGVSRLFPNNVSHISTAPQGTFGYIDPHYFQSFQLTNKSDVYAFGVVLLELLSSMPAIDTTRHSDEIGLTKLARNKIKNQEFDKLIDPQLEYQSDNEVGGMITLVARLAFRCLQEDREKRPTMEEALDALKRIESGEEVEPESEEDHDFLPLKKSWTLPTFKQ